MLTCAGDAVLPMALTSAALAAMTPAFSHSAARALPTPWATVEATSGLLPAAFSSS